MNPKGVGIVGCGNISGIYLKNLSQHPAVRIVAVADLDSSKARAVATEHNVGGICSTEELLTHPDVDIVLNLTTPHEHFLVTKRSLEAGKSAYTEKPLAITFEEGLELCEIAESNGCQLGSAPDTFLGASHQECVHLIHSGVIGDVVGFQSFMMCPGHESWHPNPDFYYQPGAGPLFDMGPYYLTALVAMLGSIKSVSSMSRRTFPSRLITSQPQSGTQIDVNVETHISSLIEMSSGAIGQLTTSFDVHKHSLPHIEIYGTLGSIQVPDPNGFGGDIKLFLKGAADWVNHEFQRPYASNSRGIGLIDMAISTGSSKSFRANGRLSLHVLEAMEKILDSATHRRPLELQSSVNPIEPMPCKDL